MAYVVYKHLEHLLTYAQNKTLLSFLCSLNEISLIYDQFDMQQEVIRVSAEICHILAVPSGIKIL